MDEIYARDVDLPSNSSSAGQDYPAWCALLAPLVYLAL